MSEIKQDAILSQRLLDAQVGVLGSMLIDPDTVPEVLSRVRDADFAEKKYRLIFQAIQARFRAGQAIDPILVRETLGGGVDSPWTSILQGLMDVTTTAAHVDDYVDALRASVTLSNLRTLGTQLAEADRLEDAQALLDQMRAQQVSRPHVQAMDMAEGLERFFDRHNGEEKPQYLSWGARPRRADLCGTRGHGGAGRVPVRRQDGSGAAVCLRHRQKSPGRVLQLRVHPGQAV
ncbi:DnaB-like helicase N-terminal domain-containing protein [Dysosmobacter welbionis]|uniref:DnaB-like helicase N-terminal domain-containing protein n=1 Tax=Dysosmobacter welbionis TaxID=2093857 RepID=UPI002356C38C